MTRNHMRGRSAVELLFAFPGAIIKLKQPIALVARSDEMARWFCNAMRAIAHLPSRNHTLKSVNPSSSRTTKIITKM
jgi:hypothetical protein